MAGYREFITGEVLTAGNVNSFLMEQAVMTFANSAARTTALAGVLREGLVTYNKDTAQLEIYDGVAWNPVSSAQENVQDDDYTLALSDVGKVIAIVGATDDVTVTVPTNSAVAFPLGSIINVYRGTEETVEIVGDGGVTVRNAGSISEEFAEVSLRKRDVNEWVLVGEVDQP